MAMVQVALWLSNKLGSPIIMVSASLQRILVVNCSWPKLSINLVFNKPMRALAGDNATGFNSLSAANGVTLSWLVDSGAGESQLPIDTSTGQWLTQGFKH